MNCVHGSPGRAAFRFGSVVAVALVVFGAGVPAFGATSPANMAVSATVQATCLNSTTPMAFGTYTSLVSASTATVTVTCTNTTPYTVSLNAGLSTGATVTNRGMTANAVILKYVLTSDSAHAVNWGLTVGTDTVAGTGNGAAQPLTVYGQIAANQFVAPGLYSDTIVATVTY